MRTLMLIGVLAGLVVAQEGEPVNSADFVGESPNTFSQNVSNENEQSAPPLAFVAASSDLQEESNDRVSSTITEPTSQPESFYEFSSSLADRGVSFETVYVTDILSNLGGGLERKTGQLHNFDFVIDVDGEKLWGGHGGSLHFYVLGNSGTSFSEHVGDAQVVSNIDAPNTWKLYEAYYQQEFFEGRFSWLGGLYDLNSEFDVIETAGLFINSSFGIGSDLSQTGENGPSIFPTTSLATRLRYNVNDRVYMQGAVFDAVAGNPDDPYGTHIHWNKDEGFLNIAEFGYENSFSDEHIHHHKVALGLWGYTQKVDELIETYDFANHKHKSNFGGYVLGETTVYSNPDNPAKNVGVFGRYGLANGQVNQVGFYAGGGVVFSGLFFNRVDDQLGVAVAHSNCSRRFIQCMENENYMVDQAETVIELSYKSQITPWLSVQPDMQYIINPGMSCELDNALVTGMRWELVF